MFHPAHAALPPPSALKLPEASPLSDFRAEPAATRSPRFPFAPLKDDFAPTILDCSLLVEAPTGKHGFVTVKGDRFVFADGTPVRFWGAQIGSWGREQVDYAVRRMRRQGINVTRLHGLEFLSARQAATSFDYSADGFARLDYLIAKLGENGLYLILDVHYPLTYRFKAGDNLPGLPEGGPAPYTQFFNEQVAAIMHRRMTDVFTHLNPHTNKRYCDDPTLALVEVLNEDSLFWGGGVPAPFRTELEEKFAGWLRQRYGDDAGLRKAWRVEGKLPLAEDEGLGPGQRVGLLRNTDFTEKFFGARPEQRIRGRDQLRFCLELEEKYWGASVAAMRQAGVRVPISGSNWQGHGFTTRAHMLGQARLDYVDRHGYWDHPQGEGNAKWRIATALFHNLPMVKAVRPDEDSLTYLGVGNLVTEKAWEQVLGKPMTISEWNTCLPNEYSLEGTGLMAAYGLLQGWDGSLEFGYFSAEWRDRLGGGSFDMLGNPPQILQFPAVSAMWLRGDVREAEVVAESLYTPETVFGWTDDRKPAPIAAALVGKVGYRFVEQDRPPIAKDIRAYWDPTNLVARSLTGELTWDAKQGFVRINTPRTQAVIGFLSAEPHTLEDVRFTSGTRFGALYVTAMDGQTPLADARRLLVTAVGPARNTGMEYETTSERSRLGVPYSRLKEVGGAPALLEAVTGELRIRSSLARQLKAWRLNVVGRRVQEITVSTQAGELSLALRPEHEAVYYELAAE